jgi:hypothetical protein
MYFLYTTVEFDFSMFFAVFVTAEDIQSTYKVVRLKRIPFPLQEGYKQVGNVRFTVNCKVN